LVCRPSKASFFEGATTRQQGHEHHVTKLKAAQDLQLLAGRLLLKKARHRAAPRELKARLMSGQALEPRMKKAQGRDCQSRVVAQRTARLDQRSKLGLLDNRL